MSEKPELNELEWAGEAVLKNGCLPLLEISAEGERSLSFLPTASCPYITISKQSCDHDKILDGVPVFLYNLTLGQRAVTPKTSDIFLGRYQKTFLSDSFKSWAFSRGQKNYSNITSLFNYEVVSSSHREVGSAFTTMAEYRFVTAELSLLLSMYCSTEPKTPKDIVFSPACQTEKSVHEPSVEAREFLSNTKNCLDFIEGCAFLCCYRDHTHTSKDMKSTRLRKYLDRRLGKTKVDTSPEAFYSMENIELICSIACSLGERFFLNDSGTEIVSFGTPETASASSCNDDEGEAEAEEEHLGGDSKVASRQDTSARVAGDEK